MPVLRKEGKLALSYCLLIDSSTNEVGDLSTPDQQRGRIVMADGGCDESKLVCKEYQSAFRKIQQIRRKSYQKVTRNFGMSDATPPATGMLVTIDTS